MRILIVLLLLASAGLAAQENTDQLLDIRYVWAKSGLTLRAAGKSGAAKIAVIPYGAKVRLTGAEGDHAEVSVLKAVEVSSDLKSKAWAMSANYLEVEWEGKTGWAYGGYLLRFPVPSPERQSIEEWLLRISGTPDTLMWDARLPDVAGRQSVYHYPDGIVRTEAMGESWGATTVVFPLVGLSEGFLIAEEFYWMARALEEYRSGKVTDMEPAILQDAGHNYLLFRDEFSSLEIRRVGGVLIITSEGGC